jgi:tight adherence protein C
MMLALVVAVVVALQRQSVARVVGAGTAAVVAMQMPVLLIPAAMLVALWAAVSRFRNARADRVHQEADLAALCDLTTVGLTGGLGIQPALEIASRHVGEKLAEDVLAVLRRARVEGVAHAMSNAEGIGSRLYRVIGQASATGAPLLGSVALLADTVSADLASTRLQAARRLPVTMLFPLTLLILPGFLLLTIAPAILDAFTRLEM